MIKYGRDKAITGDRSLGQNAHIPHGDAFVIESYNEYRMHWEIWGFASGMTEARSIYDHAMVAAAKARIRRLT